MSNGRISISATFTTSVPTGKLAQTTEVTQSLSHVDTFTDGTGLGQANRTYATGPLTLAASTGITYDLYTLTSGRDVTGAAYTNTKLKGIMVSNDSTDATCILALGDLAVVGTNMFITIFNDVAGAVIRIPAPGQLGWSTTSAAGLTVDATHKSFTLTNQSGSAVATYSLQFVFGGA